MSLKLALLLALLAASAGIGFGYLLRLIISLGKKGSMELDIKQMELRAKEEAQKIILEAEARVEEMLQKTQSEIKDQENRNKSAEDRLIKKEGLLDKRQTDLEKETAAIKARAEEVRHFREKVQQLVAEKTAELSRLAHLSPGQARASLMQIIEHDYEEDFLVRMQKLEKEGSEKYEKRAKEILAIAIQRLAVPITGEVMATAV